VGNIKIFDELRRINFKVMKDLCDLYERNYSTEDRKARLIFPKKKNGLRISEQEARVFYYKHLDESQFMYSIETPTEQVYGSEGNERSALSDLSVYSFETNKPIRQINIEFKAHTKTNTYKKDLDKLVCENKPGCWFHLFDNVNKETVSKLFKSFREKLTLSVRKAQYRDLKFDQVLILFSVISLKKKWGIEKILDIDVSSIGWQDHIKEFFEFKYSVKKDNILVDNLNGWSEILIKKDDK